MKRVYQTIVDSGKGNCMQAAIASLFDTEIDRVPHFIAFGDYWWDSFNMYLKSIGYKIKTHLCNPVLWPDTLPEYSLDRLFDYDGIDGFFYATVCSPKYNSGGDLGGVTHAVIIDGNYNVIHDPNPNNFNIVYPLHDDIYKGIRQVEIFEKI